MSSLQTLQKVDALLGIINSALNQTLNGGNPMPTSNKSITCRPFGQTSKGENVNLYTLTNDFGMSVEIINYGGHIRSLTVKNNSSQNVDVTIGLDDMFAYEHKNRYFGCIVGRYANRIANGQFELNGKTYKLAINNGPNALHGGIDNFSKKVWKTTVMSDKIGLCLEYTSPNMEEGYPGECKVSVEYILSNDGSNALEINYRATTDAPTVINLTNHAYWNLNGDFNPNSIANGSHLFKLNASYFVPIDTTSIPLSGSLQSVVNSPFDFRKLTDDLGGRIEKNKESDTQIKNGNGFDHTFVIDGCAKDKLIECAEVIGKESGIKMKVYTMQPGVQFYTANFLNGSLFGKGKVYDKRCAFCLETQHFPDSPNQKTFPSTVLNSGEVFSSTTRYCFEAV